MRIAKPAQQLALIVDHADPQPEVQALDPDRGAELAEIADRATRLVHIESARTMQIVPLGLVLAIAVKHLNAMVLAVSDIDPAIGVGADVVHDVELAGVSAGAAP